VGLQVTCITEADYLAETDSLLRCHAAEDIGERPTLGNDAHGPRFLWKLIARNAARLSCSEFGVLWLQGAKFPGSKELDPELTHPGMLLEFVTESEHSRDMSQLRENGP